MIIEDVIQNLKTAMEALTWQPSGNTSATSFVGGVYSAPVLEGVEGSPWMFIHDLPSPVEKRGSRGAQGRAQYNKRQSIGLHICANYGTIEDTEENARRLRYAQEAVENWIALSSNLTDAGFTQGWDYTGWESFREDSLNIEIRLLRLVNSFII